MHTPSADEARFERASDQSLLIYFGQQITRKTNERVRRFLRLLELEPVAGVRNLHPAYCSVLVKFDATRWRHEELEGKLREYLDRLEEVALPEPRLVEIPVCYGEEYGPDLDEIATLHGTTPEHVIELHASTTYLVYFFGFVPGFAYLGELPEALVTPRLATPRKKVPAGSLGIAGNQTGVYPFETPGGWRLLGRTPLAMFRTDREGLSLVSLGDQVRFVPISRERFAALEKETTKRSASPTRSGQAPGGPYKEESPHERPRGGA
jgi:KipI family sensor histidine kinase inhibitor